jgi:hypothetical protein
LLDHFELQTLRVAPRELPIDTSIGEGDSHQFVNDRLDGVFTSQSLIKRLFLGYGVP